MATLYDRSSSPPDVERETFLALQRDITLSNHRLLVADTELKATKERTEQVTAFEIERYRLLRFEVINRIDILGDRYDQIISNIRKCKKTTSREIDAVKHGVNTLNQAADTITETTDTMTNDLNTGYRRLEDIVNLLDAAEKRDIEGIATLVETIGDSENGLANKIKRPNNRC
ncbi:hypothetical protein P3342_005293 [Pyrenophora teres f. teres]|uniref:Uncharacterized protein n=2 Tax=Pyrenophora teres f. teres TaxID=97479 RepID=E3S9Z3_PYRTT|nr:hypothetical protein PTT_19904 [Pyrenophora teres f. teres 0-1]KAE8846175.1 hypothetical protein HRS9139_00742 [Pyrenophora teres f. teres]CAA9959913.1 hypothetical protein PTMSG1_03321 [Pyrenophora teres f. maculata]KAE8848315.1 hypothetical protein PTNB85_02158 [Pyrenophora teres f. teres]KAE8853519.1 hypothetical protein HRS9122_00511 [Pyrenophora teres f. teres]